MTIVTKPQGRIPVGYTVWQGQRVAITIDIEWDRYLSTLTAELNRGLAGFTGAQGSAGAAIAMLGDDESEDDQIIVIQQIASTEQELAQTISTTTAVTARSGTLLVDTTGGDVTITLPANGLFYRVKRISGGTNTLTIATASGMIDDAATMTLDIQYESVSLKSDGTDYWIT